ncbi:berberine bridge enzyme-like 8 [Syzygium oleosum]|uniref:berberine bridge enzyme-like 8 n=1 Tax=Syzygium oleosum TaxID=219896 RepID=UPI0024BA3520|nr:berberine bridge enzyme-like 8 [Syzygium oleosum]
MGTSFPNSKTIYVFSLLVLFLASFSSPSEAFANETLTQCLINHSQPSHPIISAINTPAESSFSTVLQSYIRNLRFNTSETPKPTLILTALHESHVQAAIICAQKLSVQMNIRSGGHDYEGISYVSIFSPFFILDMLNFRSVDIDIEAETAWVQAGATLGEVYYGIAAKSKVHGFSASVCPTVSVGGHFSGGGYGNMMRKYGLSVDNIVDAHIINVSGEILDRESMGEDLFWAIRGGGGASFAVILAYKINLVRVPETVTVFNVSKTREQNATEIVYKWEEVAHKLHEDLFIRLTMVVTNGTLTAWFRALFLGDAQRLLSLMSDSFPELGLRSSECIEMSWVESTLYWYDFPIETKVDALLSRTPHVLTHLKRKSDYVKQIIPKDGLELIWKRMIKLDKPRLTFNPYGGKMGEIPANSTPFPHRAGNLWKVQYATDWNVSGEEAARHYIKLTRKLYRYMTPFVSKNPRDAFFNYRDLDLGINHNGDESYEEGKVYGVKYFKDNFDRLVEIKTKVDPANFFRNEQSVPILPP